MRTSIRALLVFVGLTLGSGALRCSDVPRRSAGGPQYGIGQEVEAEGTVAENVLGCRLDAACYLRLKTSGGEVVVVYVTPMGTRCVNKKVAQEGMKIRKGTRIRIFARATGPAELSTCDDEKYFLIAIKNH